MYVIKRNGKEEEVRGTAPERLGWAARRRGAG